MSIGVIWGGATPLTEWEIMSFYLIDIKFYHSLTPPPPTKKNLPNITPIVMS